MARQPMVTRTIQTTEATLLCVDISTKSPLEKTVILPRTYKNNEHILKAAEPEFSGTNIKPVHVITAEVKQTLYGMKESKFVALATPIEKPNKDKENDSLETPDFDEPESAE